MNSQAKGHWNHRRMLPGLLSLGLVLTAHGAYGAWVVEPSASLGTTYNDNIDLRPNNEDDGINTTVDLQSRVRRVTEASEISGLAGVNLSKYSNVDTISTDLRTTAFVELATRREFERSGFDMRGSYRRQDLLRNLAVIDSGDFATDSAAPLTDGGPTQDTDLGDDLVTDADPDQGSVQRLVRRNIIRVAPNFGYQISPRTTVSLGYSFNDQSYDDPDSNSSLQDSRTNAGTLRLQRAMSLSDSAWLEVQRSWFEPETNLDSDTWSGVLGWRRAVSERITVEVGAGGRRTENDFESNTGFLFNGRVDRTTERGRLFVLLSRSLQPDAYGNQVDLDRFRVGMTQRISERMSWTLDGNASRTERSSSTNFNNQSDRDYVSAGVSIQRAFTRSLSVRANYDYTWVDRKDEPDAASGNAVGLSLVYVPPRRL